MKPLAGTTIVTLEHAIAAPSATRQLADLGARVIKVERLGVGEDFARGYDERVNGLASHFVWTNRSKESLTLDVKHPEASDHPEAPDHRTGRTSWSRTWRRERRRPACRTRALSLISRKSSSATSPATAMTALSRPQSLRSADPGRGRVPVGHRHRGNPPRRGRRSRTSPPDVRLFQHPCGAAPAAEDRTRPAPGHLHAGIAGRMDELSPLLRLRRRTAAGSAGRQPRHHLSLRPVSGAGMARRCCWGFRTNGNGPPSATWCCGSRVWRPKSVSPVISGAMAARDELRGIIAEASSLTAEQVIAWLDEARIANSRANDMHDVWEHPQLKARNRWRMWKRSGGRSRRCFLPVHGRKVIRMDAVPSLGHTDAIRLSAIRRSGSRACAPRRRCRPCLFQHTFRAGQPAWTGSTRR